MFCVNVYVIGNLTPGSSNLGSFVASAMLGGGRDSKPNKTPFCSLEQGVPWLRHRLL